MWVSYILCMKLLLSCIFKLDEIGSLLKSMQKAGVVYSKDAHRQYLWRNVECGGYLFLYRIVHRKKKCIISKKCLYKVT